MGLGSSKKKESNGSVVQKKVKSSTVVNGDKKYKIKSQIGEGAFSFVYMVSIFLRDIFIDIFFLRILIFHIWNFSG